MPARLQEQHQARIKGKRRNQVEQYLRELGGEGKRGVLGVVGVLESKRLEADKVDVTIRTNGRVWGEHDRLGVRDIDLVRDHLKGDL
jgi:hypothetical protein